MKYSGNIVLFGFMGTGKSAVARRLGEILDRPVIEMDELIEEREGMTISRIFAERGEDYFRKRERELVRELAAGRGKIVATGGGVVLDPANIRDLSREGLAVCLTARPEVILNRVAGESHRPLLERADRLETIEKMLKSRKSCYEKIPHRIDTSGLSVEEVAARVLGILGNGE
jgi:shikimate kinase